MAIPATDIRVIERITVFKVTSFNSLFAYVWLLIILMGISEDMVEVWEGVLTLLFFPIMIVVAYLADIGYFDSGRTTGVVRARLHFVNMDIMQGTFIPIVPGDWVRWGCPATGDLGDRLWSTDNIKRGTVQ